MDRRLRTVRRFAWGVLGYTVLVILWGGFVRASGAGAGCGDHWPLCNGELVPTAPALNTVIEFGHRVTSGLALPAVLVLAWLVFRAFPRGAAVRTVSVVAVVFMVLEGAIGAGLVLFEYVAYNPSIARAAWMAAHLTNTFLLLGALTLTAWWAEGKDVPRLDLSARTARVGATLAAVLVLGAGGAVTALGDTLVLGGGLDPAEHPVVAALVAARVFHPTMAFVVLAVLGVTVALTRAPRPRQIGWAVLGLFVVQMAIGALNVWLLAPVWMQIVHLLVTDLIWIGLVVFASEALAAPDAVAESAGRGGAAVAA
ncbi:COX15/CtaA family protein [Rubrivirga sp. S365]|uniref:COX15/CtaA family protein n=1 Tax=Rubrivirga litoralis TaxID=3075598 RepID=A0ABU3BMN4_9BACT|nr:MULTISPECIES: COX15/CtaA family protein [unclassified Rubrivirga]MDT0630520.1 COX15/CtaA family protein [Rubrivirga sp. F394]MDT7856865.1 COX15/CtaA family protein [Rubrivirga sp. S365]